MDILNRVFPVESAHMATLHAQSKKLSDLWALGALLVRLPVRAVGIPPLTGVTARVGTEMLTHGHDTDEFRLFFFVELPVNADGPGYLFSNYARTLLHPRW